MAVHAFDSSHDDLIHDVSYDFYGKRLVTCSSDQKLKVWEFNQDTSSWELVDSWRAHECSVLKVSWAHPEFGQVIASCSFDRSVRIWEEQEHEPKNSNKRWALRANLVDSSGSVKDIEFAPNNWGLKLATVAADGVLRIYEALEVNNLSDWSMMEEVGITNPGTVNKEVDGNYCLSWCPWKPQVSPMIVVGCGKENCAKIFRPNPHNKWIPFEVLHGHDDAIHDVSWAPNMGRSYHLIATASKDHKVGIFKLSNKPDGYSVENIAMLPDHGVEVWKVEWNITGTILSSSGDDGKVRLWKSSHNGEWKCMSVISYERQTDNMEM
ncbi:WD40 repeat-like protein [Gigaspora margarita]|uniref:WD40 repeat-like protein n=1 Tax=Gigaspora margarita TaxID=4874 RepID=A0A8H3ZV71_GIGMA|nr:WD40 repeat-like protein [Gigaspora margarita]